MFDLDKEIENIKKYKEVQLKKRKEEKDKFKMTSLDDALSIALLKLTLDINQREKGGNDEQ
tara:strand:- start:106 stop:288 length:183 start_codon:yes stop_codon:yes gene_type:complete